MRLVLELKDRPLSQLQFGRFKRGRPINHGDMSSDVEVSLNHYRHPVRIIVTYMLFYSS